MHPESSFLTLTYDEKKLPADFSVHVEVWQKFMKALRKKVPQKLRLFACGEYGDENLHPHYHALIFNYRPTDLVFWKDTKAGYPIYRSAFLEKIWSNGYVFVGNVTYQSAAYCARYIFKKVGGPLAPDNYCRVHPVSLQLVNVAPEFAVQSRRPGLGARWASEFKSDFDTSDEIVVDGKSHPVPRYYHRYLTEKENNHNKYNRAVTRAKNKSEYTKERLGVREVVKSAQISRLKREI